MKSRATFPSTKLIHAFSLFLLFLLFSLFSILFAHFSFGSSNLENTFASKMNEPAMKRASLPSLSPNSTSRPEAEAVRGFSSQESSFMRNKARRKSKQRSQNKPQARSNGKWLLCSKIREARFSAAFAELDLELICAQRATFQVFSLVSLSGPRLRCLRLCWHNNSGNDNDSNDR